MSRTQFHMLLKTVQNSVKNIGNFYLGTVFVRSTLLSLESWLILSNCMYLDMDYWNLEILKQISVLFKNTGDIDCQSKIKTANYN
jgi:hypothetical protein